VPATVTIPAGQTSATFNVTMQDDHVIDGNRPITVTAQMDNWTSGSATMTDIDDDGTVAVSLPASGWEGQTLTNAGTVTLGGTLSTSLTVSLVSSDPTKLSVPATVTIPANQTTATFTVTLLNNGLHTGPVTDEVTATTVSTPDGVLTGSATMVVSDSNVDRYTFTAIAAPKTAGVAFPVTITADDCLGNPILVYNGTAALTAAGQAGTLGISPTTVTFATGTWTGNVTVNAVDPTVTLTATSSTGATGTSNVFATQAGPVASFQWSTIASPEYENVPFPVTVTAKDANGYTATGYSGTANLTGLVGTTTPVTMLNEPTPTNSYPSGSWTLGQSFTPSANLQVTDFLHYFGTQVSLWTSTGVLLDSQTFNSTPGSWVDTPLTTPIQLTGGTTYVLGVYTSGSYYWRTDMSSTCPAGTINQALYGSGNTFPTATDSGVAWWLVDLRGNLGTYTSVPVSPTTATFAGGVWTGNLTIQQAKSGMHLHIDNGAGQTGDSNMFNVSAEPPVTPVLPANVTVGDGVDYGTLTIPAALTSDLAVSLTSGDANRLTVPATVTIPAGDTSVPLPLTIIDNGLLYGPEAITIGATATGYAPCSATLTLHDDLTAALSVSLPASASEDAGVLTGAGTVTSSAPAQNAVVVQLASSDTTRVTVPATVTIPAGQTSATFNVTMHDDGVIDGNRPISVTAQMDNWTSGLATMTDIDDDGTLSVSLPASGWEGQTLTNAGTVTLGGTLSTPLTVSLVSSDPTRLSVPATVTIPTGQTTATFTATLLNPGLHTGPVTDEVTATTVSTPDGVLTGSATMVVSDSNVDHYTFTAIAAPKTAGVAFPVTITADDCLGNPILVYNGTAALTAAGQAGALGISPTTVTFASGTWTGNVTVNAVDPTVTLTATSSTGATGTSNVFATQAGPLASFQWSTIASPQVQNVPFSATLTAKDANGYTVTSFGGTVSLSAQNNQGAVSITPTVSGSFISGVWTGSITALQAATGVYLVGSDGAGHVGDSDTFTVSPIPAPDLTVALTDSGSFKQGDVGDTYTITATNSGTLPTTAAVSVADLLPAGLTATAFSGSGWTTNLATLTATRSDVLAAGASYPALTLTVTVAMNAPASVTNQAIVSGGGEVNTGNDTATDVTAIKQFPDLTITKTHSGNFVQGDTGDAYKITVANSGTVATNGAVTVVDSLPAGLTATAISGSGWTVTLSTLTATRSDVLAAGASYPALTLLVNVSVSAPASLTNKATVSGGGEINTTNDTASDPTVINSLPAPTVSPITATINNGMVEAGTQVLALRFNEAVVGGGTAANYKLQSAGPDGLLGTADDQIMPLAVHYQAAVATLTVPALPEGVYRLTVFDTITNVKGVPLNGNGTTSSNWVRDFVVTPSSQLFASTPTYPTGGVDPVAIVSGDFNGDGFSDLAVANYTSGTVSVLLADGSGGFLTATTYSSGGSEPRALVAGDFNGDGNLDLAVANYGSNNVGLLLGNGKGGFAAPVTFSTGGIMPDALAAADFNHDGNLDLAVANYGSNNVGVLLGNGHGGFATAATFGTGGVNPGAHYLALGDFNGDGNTDIAVDSSSQTIGILLGNGGGGFAAAETFVPGVYQIDALAAADFNGDGKTDLAVAGAFSGGESLGVFLATGNGGFGAVNPVTGSWACALVVGDFNGDGKADVAAADGGLGDAEVLLGNGSGGFTAMGFSCGGGAPSAICVGDFNGDGQSDLAVALPGGNLVGVLLGEGNGSFAAIAGYETNGLGGALSVATGDFNGDGRSGVATADDAEDLSVFLPNSLGQLGTPTVYPTGGSYPMGLAASDFNGDGNTDLAVGNASSASSSVGVFLGNGSGGFSAVTTYPGGQYPSCIAVGDFNGDGKTDLALSNYNGSTVSVMLGNGNGGFGPPTAYSTGGTDDYSVAVGDFNGDGKEDLAVANYANGTVSVLLGDGTGKFGAPMTFSSGGTDPISVVVGDFNGDGKTDIAVANNGSDTVGVLWGNGNGGFSGPTILACNGFAPWALTVGDFNGDGHSDLAVSGSPDTVAVYLGNGSGAFTGPVLCSSGEIPYYYDASIATGDFNGDGRTDLAVANGDVGILLNIYGPAPTTLTSQDGTVFDVATGSSGAGQLVEGTNNAFHGDGRLLVGGNPYSPTLLTSTLSDGGCSVTTGTGTVAGLSVSRNVTVPNTGSQDFARTLDSFANPTGSPITTTVTVVGDLGSGLNTSVFATSDGTGIVSPNDQWIGTDGGAAPAVITYIHGPAGLKPTSVAVTGSNISWTYNLTVPAGQTVTLAYFTIVSPTPAAAIAAANALVTPGGFGGQAGAFLSAPQLFAIANFLFAPMATVVLNEHSPLPNDVLTATATKSDAYGNPVSLSFVWTVNGTVERTFTSATALTDSFNLNTLGAGDAGDTVVLAVTPNDGISTGATVTDTATVVDAPPVATVVLNEHSPRAGDVLTATATESDADGNPVTLTYVWMVNGTVERTFTSTALTDSFNLGTLGPGDVGDTVVVAVTPNDGLLAGTTVTDTTTVIDTPRVVNVVVGSDAWSSSFLSYLAAQNPSNAGGYSIPVGSGAQLLPLPWTNIDEIKVTFNENVIVAQADMMLVGVNTPSYNVAGGAFSYNAATFTATWTLPAAIPDDKLLLELNADGSDPIHDASGNRLDGEWTSPATTADTGTSQYPSGDGVPGGNFLFRFNVLPGNVSQDGYVQALDALLVRGALGSSAGQGNYSIFKDLNGDGYVLSSDGLLVRGQLGTSLPAADPVAAPFPAAAENGAVGARSSAGPRPLEVALLSIAAELESGVTPTPLLDPPAASSPLLSTPAAITSALQQANHGDRLT
jgi:uncharacterized repeat protein (TIGR01451 family)